MSFKCSDPDEGQSNLERDAINLETYYSNRKILLISLCGRYNFHCMIFLKSVQALEDNAFL